MGKDCTGIVLLQEMKCRRSCWSFATVIKKLLIFFIFLPPDQEMLNLTDVEFQVQEVRDRLVCIPLCLVCVYVYLRVHGQPSPISRGLDTGRI